MTGGTRALDSSAPEAAAAPTLDTSMALAIARHNAGDLGAAIAMYREVLAVDPAYFDAVHLMGVAVSQMGELSLAEKLIRAALALQPRSAEALNNLGGVCFEQGKLDEALQCYLGALESRPEYADAYCNLGNVLLKTERLDEARACYEQAIALQPGSAAACSGLGRLHLGLHDLPGAEQWLLRGLALAPGHAELLNNLALVTIERGLPEQALPLLDRIVAQPASRGVAATLYALAESRMQDDPLERDRLFHGGLIERAEALARADLARANSVDHHNFLLKCHLASPSHDAQAYFDESRRWALAHADEQLLPLPSSFPNRRDPDRRLAVGIVGDYFDSSIGRCTLHPFFRQHDRERLRVFCYNFGGGESELRPIVDDYRDVGGMSSEGFFKQVRADGIDILLDINGRLRTPNFFDAMLRQPAPVQVNWYNLTATVGVRAYNYLIADDYSVRAGDAHLYVEKIFNMPNGTISAWDMGAPPRVPGPPLARNGYPTFGCFGDFFKVNDGVIRSWAALLLRVQGAKLYLKSANLRLRAERVRIAQRFAELGIAGERLILEGPSPYPIMKRLYEAVDVALDTFPYSSGSSSINALWQGVPVVAIGGEAWRSRNTASILVGAGLERYIARDGHHYLDLAQALAQDSAHLAEQRERLGEYLLTTPQWQTQAFAVNFEVRLRAIWRDWLREAGS
ncbi:MAG: tetratricopeptide repeat protein [Proteobacteria bacterium]|nr:tetratricopeptide repeat protein [Burkholderiales bacterium]